MSWRLRLQYLWRFTVPSEDYCSRRHRLAGAWQKTKGFHGSRVVQFWSGNVLQNKFHIPAVSPCSALSHCWKIFIASASFLTMPESIFLSTATVSVSLQLRKIVDFLRRTMRKTSVIFNDVQYLFLKNAVVSDAGTGSANRENKSEITLINEPDFVWYISHQTGHNKTRQAMIWLLRASTTIAFLSTRIPWLTLWMPRSPTIFWRTILYFYSI